MSRTCIVISDVDFSSRCAIGSNMMFLVSGLYSQKHGSVPSYGIFALGPHWSATCSDLHHWPDSEMESSGPGSLFTLPPHGNGRHIYLAAPTRATQMLSFFVDLRDLIQYFSNTWRSTVYVCPSFYLHNYTECQRGQNPEVIGLHNLIMELQNSTMELQLCSFIIICRVQ